MPTWNSQYTQVSGPVLTQTGNGKPTSEDTTDLVLEGPEITHVSLGFPCSAVSSIDVAFTDAMGAYPTQNTHLDGPIPDIIGTIHPVLFMGNNTIASVKYFKMRARDSSKPSNNPYITWRVQYTPDFSGSEAPIPHGTLTEITIADTWDQVPTNI